LGGNFSGLFSGQVKLVVISICLFQMVVGSFWFQNPDLLVSNQWLELRNPGSDVLQVQCNQGQNIKTKATQVQNQRRA